MNSNVTSDNLQYGMGVTIQYYSDREPATIIQITHNGKRIVIQKDKSIRIDNNGMSESQSYNFEVDSNGATFIATKRKDGTYRLVGNKTIVRIGNRSKYHDFSF